VQGKKVSGGDQRLQQVPDVVIDGVADLPHERERLAGGVGDRPVLVARAGIDRTGVAAAEGDDDVGGADHLVGQRLGELERDVHPDLGHRLHHDGVDLLVGVGAR